MRKSVLAIVGAFAFIVGPAAFAASFTSTANQNIDVTIPDVAFLRINGGGSAISFSPTPNQVATGATLTGTAGQDVLQALVNKGSWALGVTISSKTGSWGNGLDLSQITVTTAAGGTGVPSLKGSFSLADVDTGTGFTDINNNSVGSGITISTTTGSQTQGWQNVGIDAGSYSLALSGAELPGSYSVDVTYVLATP